MPLETGTYISDLVATNPLGSDGKDKGDDHIRFVKSTIKTTFPNVNGAVNPSPNEFNFLVGVTSSIQAQFSAKGAVIGQTWTGTHDYTGAVLNVATQAAGDSSTKAASTAFAASLAFASSLPAQAGNAGKGVTTNGTVASWASFFPAISTVRAANFTALSNSSHDCNTTSAAFTLTLPVAPAAGDWVSITDYAGTFATNNLTVGKNGLNIMGLAEDMILSTNNASFYLQYSDAIKGWLIK